MQDSRGRVLPERRCKLTEGIVVLLAVLVFLLLADSGGLFFYFGVRHAAPESGVKATATDRAHVAETATARVSGTVNTQRSATATAIAANLSPYPPYRERLVLSDPLSENNGGQQWQVFIDSATGMAGQNQPNTIAIVANGNSFDLYVNGRHVAGAVSDGNLTSSHGMIGVYGQGTDATTEVAYSDVKVWA